MSLAVITGFAAEARIAGAPGVAALIGAGRADRLAADLETAIAGGARRLLSFGVAGALTPHLEPGDLVVGRALIDGARRTPCDAGWSAAMKERLNQAAPSLRTFFADVASADAPVADPAAKAALHAATGAAAVDMESALVAQAAERHGLPFAILRAIADPAHRALPPAALAAMRADGGVDLAAVLGALGRGPRQLTALVGLALDSRRAFGALARARALLGADFASLDLGEL
ncbi:MAG: phosphorylase [Roseiarcus sp.]|jgi:hopanoid-associated phosphorylase